MQKTDPSQIIDIEVLKAQVDAEIEARLLAEADYARYIHRRGFQVGEMKLLVSMDAASEVAEMPPLFRLPGAPAGVAGLVNRHGRVVPVIDLQLVMGPGGGRKPGSWLLIYGHGDEAVGLIVDSLPDRKRFAQEDAVMIEGLDQPIGPFAKAAYQDGVDVWIDLDAEALFASVFDADSNHV